MAAISKKPGGVSFIQKKVSSKFYPQISPANECLGWKNKINMTRNLETELQTELCYSNNLSHLR